MGLLFILIFLYQIGCDNIEDGILSEEGSCASYGKVACKMKEM